MVHSAAFPILMRCEMDIRMLHDTLNHMLLSYGGSLREKSREGTFGRVWVGLGDFDGRGYFMKAYRMPYR